MASFVEMLIRLVTTSFKPVKASCQWKSKLYLNFVMKELIGLCSIVRSGARIHSAVQPRIIPMPEDDEDERSDSDDSDRKDKMSFSYWGADKVALQKPLAKDRPGPGGIGSRRNGSTMPSDWKMTTRMKSGIPMTQIARPK